LDALDEFVDRANARLLENRPEPCRKALLQACLSAFDFLRAAARLGPNYATLSDRDASGPRFRILCLDAGPHISEATSRSKAAIFFSATLTPLEHFREALGGQPENLTLRLPSPFPCEHLGLFIAAHISTEYRDRSASAEAIAGLLACAAQTRPGTHIAYFPSYEYLRKVREVFVAAYPAIPAPAQQPVMDETAKTVFLQRLLSPEQGVPTIAFAVLGGLFAEGIDLPGGNIAGICIIGVGLPQLCLERDLIRRRSEAMGRDGFAAAYAYPGLNRVLQAAGRLIRSESDAGTVVLIDRRFAREEYGRLFPEHWQHARIVSSLAELRAAIAAFPRPA
jgi:Rad3-related DNA helicase